MRNGYAVEADKAYETASGTLALAGGLLAGEGAYEWNGATVVITGTNPGDMTTMPSTLPN